VAIVIERSAARRVAGNLTLLNAVALLLLVAGGLGLSRLLAAPRFGVALVLVTLLTAAPLALVMIVKLRLGVALLFVVSMTIIAVKRLAWELEVGLLLEALEGLLIVGIALSIVRRRDGWRLRSPMTGIALTYIFYQAMMSMHPGLPGMMNVVYALREPMNMAVPFFAALYLVRDRRQLRLFLYFWLATALLIALYGLKQAFIGLTTWEAAWLSVSRTHLLYDRVRIFSTLGSADALGMHMAVSMVVALAVAFSTRVPLIRYGCIGIVPILLMANLYTLTRGAYLAVLVGVLSLAMLTRNRSMLLALLLAAVGIVGWYQVNEGSLLAGRVMTMFSPEEDESYTVRQNYIQTYLPVILDSPFGLGPNTSGRQGWVLLEWGGIDPSRVESLAGVPTDNYYFRIALEYGWIGLMVLLGMFAYVAIRAGVIFLKAKDPLAKATAAAFLASFAAMAVSSMSNNYFSHPDLRLFFWFTLGVVAKLPRIEAVGEVEPVSDEEVTPRHLAPLREPWSTEAPAALVGAR
jgi:putative inorganic carbon (hco3(-)) transporter